MNRIYILLFLLFGQLNAQTLDTTLWMVNTGGRVNDMVKDGNILYIGGSFSKLGRNTGCLANLSLSDGQMGSLLPNISPGSILSTVSDGNGGWFVGGTFSIVNGSTFTNLIHIKPDGKLNTAFNPAPNGAVRAMVVRNGKLYIAGSFNSIASQSRISLAEMDIASGLITAWNPGVNNTVYCLALSGNKLYMGGAFTNVNGQGRARAAGIDLATGVITAWNPGINNGVVNTLMLHGDKVYLGGTFSTINSVTRNRIASVDTLTGALSGWNPDANNSVNVLVPSGSRVYVGGSFTSIGSFGINRLAAIDTGTGVGEAWNPNPDGPVNAILLKDSLVYAGGGFANIGGLAQKYLARINPAGQAIQFDAGLNNTVNTLAINGNAILAGGTFGACNEITRNNLAAIDLLSGKPTSWNPNANNTVNALALYQNALVVGGNFTTIAGSPASKLSLIDKESGALSSTWTYSMSGSVSTLALQGQTLFFAGSFTNVGGQSRTSLASIDLSSGQLSNFKPNISGTISKILLSGNNLFVAGTFTKVATLTRNNLASINIQSGEATNWDPNVNNAVNALLLNGKDIYIGGTFTKVGSTTRVRLALLDTSSAALRSWAVGTNNSVYSIALAGSTIYLAGDFDNVLGNGRIGLAAVDTAGNLLSWNPKLNDDVFSLLLSNECGNERIFAGGNFTSVKSIGQCGIAAISGVNHLSVGKTITHVRCNGAADGAVDISISGGVQPYTYSKDNQTFQQSGQFTGLSGGEHTFYVKDANNCTFEVYASIDEPEAIVANEVLIHEVCAGQQNGAIHLNPGGGTPPYTYNWSNGGTAQAASGLSAGTYTVVITDHKGCTQNKSFTITSNPLPEAVFAFGFEEDSVRFTNQSTGAPDSYTWDFGDSQSSALSDPAHAYAAMGSYKVCLTVSNACGSDSSCTIVQVAGFNLPESLTASVRIMPNPAAYNCRIETGSREPLEWSLCDLTGRTVLACRKENQSSFLIDLSGLEQGIYLVNIRQKEKFTSLRLVKE